jgi:hypothetical protein
MLKELSLLKPVTRTVNLNNLDLELIANLG